MSTTLDSTMIPTVVLEPAAQALADALATGGGPPLYALSPDGARAVLDQAQSGNVSMAPAEIQEHTIPGGPDGVSITVVKPGTEWQPARGRLHARRRLGPRQLRDSSALGARPGADRAGFVFVNYPRRRKPAIRLRSNSLRHGRVGRRTRSGAGAGRQPAGHRRRERRRQYDRCGRAPGERARRAGHPLSGALYPVTNALSTPTPIRSSPRPWLTRNDGMVLGCLPPDVATRSSQRPRRSRPWISCGACRRRCHHRRGRRAARRGRGLWAQAALRGRDVTAVRYEGSSTTS